MGGNPSFFLLFIQGPGALPPSRSSSLARQNIPGINVVDHQRAPSSMEVDAAVPAALKPAPQDGRPTVTRRPPPCNKECRSVRLVSNPMGSSKKVRHRFERNSVEPDGGIQKGPSSFRRNCVEPNGGVQRSGIVSKGTVSNPMGASRRSVVVSRSSVEPDGGVIELIGIVLRRIFLD